MSLFCALGIHRWNQFLLPSLPDGSVWPGQLQRRCDRCARHEACFPTKSAAFFESDWFQVAANNVKSQETSK
jgi:hypothetical protein